MHMLYLLWILPENKKILKLAKILWITVMAGLAAQAAIAGGVSSRKLSRLQTVLIITQRGRQDISPEKARIFKTVQS